MIISKDNKQYAQEIAITTIPFDICTKCNRKLISGYAEIPGNIPSLQGKTCPSCGRFHLTSIKNLDHYLAAHYYQQRYRSSKFSLWRYAKEEILESENESNHLHHLKTTPGAALLVILQDEEGKEHEVFIVTSKSYENKAKKIIYLWTKAAMNLLTIAFHKENKGRTFTLNGKKYTVKTVYSGDDSNGIIKTPTTIYLRKNGGYYNPSQPENPLVTALVFSPFTRHYEGMTVTYDTKEDVYYVDSTKFRDFIHKYGNPGVHIGHYISTGSYGFDWSDLRDSSFLMDYGYNVSYNDNLPRSVRHEMLAEIVDLQIATVSEIITHLNFCISTHAKYKSAVDCWTDDMEFISMYKVNPQRFMIAGEIKKQK